MLYPTTAHLRDYLSWRQADVHVNNLFNTTFWALVGSGISAADAERRLKGTLASDKHEILFSEFGINYNNEKSMYRKGSTIIRNKQADGIAAHTINQIKQCSSVDDTNPDHSRWEHNLFSGLVVSHEDIIGKKFWESHPDLLNPPDSRPPRIRS